MDDGESNSDDHDGSVEQVEDSELVHSFSPSIDGSTVKPLYVERTPTVYGVMESELENLTAWNFISNVSFSVGSFFLSIFIALNIEFVGTATLSEVAHSLILWMKLASIGLVVITWGLGAYFWRRRSNQLAIIKRESKISSR